MKYSIGIVTFENRFESYFKPLIKKIKNSRPDIEITVCINGQYKKPFNQTYLKEVLHFNSTFSNIFPQVFTKFNSLAKLWNRLVLNSTENLVLILNDDIDIDETFFDLIEKEENVFENKLVLFNGIFSHFFIDRNLLQSLNWFDERFLGVGKEDRDIQQKVKCYNIMTPLIRSKHRETSIPIENMKTYGEKYTKFNESVFSEKYDKNNLPESIQYPYYKFEQENYIKL